jgi:hypothetical protein
MIYQLDNFCSANSQLMIFCGLPIAERQERLQMSGFDQSALRNLSLTHLQGNSTTRKDLETIPLESYDSILILADEEYENTNDGGGAREIYADSRTLSCLLLIRDIQNRRRKAEKIRRKSIISTLRNIGFSDNNSQHAPDASPKLMLRRPSMTKLTDAQARKSGKQSPKFEAHLRTHIMTEHVDDKMVAMETQKNCAVISEILDARTRPLVSIASTTDYVTSNELVSEY